MLTRDELHKKIAAGVRLLDGATGSNLMKAGMPRGGCTETWVLEHPDALIDLQSRYAQAGSQILYAPTFQAQPIALDQQGLANRTDQRRSGSFDAQGVGRRAGGRQSDHPGYFYR